MRVPVLSSFVACQKLKLADRLLRDFPGLEGQPREDLGALAYKAAAMSADGWGQLGMIVVLHVTSVAAVHVLLNALSTWWDLGVPYPFAILAGALLAAFFIDRVHQRRLHRVKTRLVAAAFPDLYCPCGYCLRGQVAPAACPECGRLRHLDAPASYRPLPAEGGGVKVEGPEGGDPRSGGGP